MKNDFVNFLRKAIDAYDMGSYRTMGMAYMSALTHYRPGLTRALAKNYPYLNPVYDDKRIGEFIAFTLKNWDEYDDD